MTKTLQKTSRLLAQVLRHAPEKIGVTLDPQGWVEVNTLLPRLAAFGHRISRADLEQIVATSDKKRFTLSGDGTQIRAAQGHSVPVVLGVPAKQPPEVLYHGTAVQNIAPITEQGLKPGGRQQVHLSADRDTALKVGQRHGKPVILTVDAGRMSSDGFAFYQADNGVWLTDHVPPKYLNT